MDTPQTETPETDAATFEIKERGSPMPMDVTAASFARALERRAIATEARVKELEAAIEFKETCQTCNALCDPADVEAGECIWCIAKQFKRERDEARAALCLRPIAEAGPVPDGAVRIYGQYSPKFGWTTSRLKCSSDTHFIDIYPPQQ